MKDYDVRTYREFIPSFDVAASIFNVAASIKMRKSVSPDNTANDSISLPSMWPHP